MNKILLALVLLVSSQAHALTAGTTIRLKHSVSNLSTTTNTQLFGTLVTLRNTTYLDVENNSLSGTIIIATGCTPNNNTMRNVLHINPGFSKTVPLSVGRGDCVQVFAADSTINTGTSSYTLFFE